MIKNNFSNALVMFFMRVCRKVGQWNLHLFFLVLPEEGRAVKSTFVFPGFSRSIYAQALTNLVFHRRKGRDSGAETGEMFRVSPALGISIIHPWQPCSTFSIIHSFFSADCDRWRIGCQDRWIDYHLSVHAQKSTDVMPFCRYLARTPNKESGRPAAHQDISRFCKKAAASAPSRSLARKNNHPIETSFLGAKRIFRANNHANCKTTRLWSFWSQDHDIVRLLLEGPL